MSQKEDKKSSSKALLYSEILNTSVGDHVNELLQKKNKSFTHHVQRSSVLDRVSKLLQTIDKVSDDVRNIEEVEEGEPVIDMSVTLIERSELDSEIDTENEDDLENDAEGKIILCSDSKSGQSRNESLIDESVDISYDLDSEPSEVEKYESMNNLISSDLVSESPEIKKYMCEDICASYADTDDEQSESSDTDDEQSENYDSGNEQSENESKELILGSHILPESNDEIPEESEENVKGKNYLEPSKSNFELLISDLSVPKFKYHSYKNNLGLYDEKKRKLISVIEDDDENLSLSKKQKRV